MEQKMGDNVFWRFGWKFSLKVKAERSRYLMIKQCICKRRNVLPLQALLSSSVKLPSSRTTGAILSRRIKLDLPGPCLFSTRRRFLHRPGHTNLYSLCLSKHVKCRLSCCLQTTSIS
ncbi:hypothetical protein Nepgr_022626 [Nepenthes gracilis]|uniref:Uncharacterized protein n=1 Tax=Nepenthes gracilis TaxID=150966 RepID=A0AAD3T145_NEPGR|nr:hypothetical protein Nepgr_022626 [Nepenthes gracilis]